MFLRSSRILAGLYIQLVKCDFPRVSTFASFRGHYLISTFQLARSAVEVRALIEGSSEPAMKYKQRLAAESIAEEKEEENFYAVWCVSVCVCVM